MTKDWQEIWVTVEQKDIGLKILGYLADSTNEPTTTSDLAINKLGLGGPNHEKYTKARNQLADLGFIVYLWGEPVVLADAFRGFVDSQGENWQDVLEGTSEPAPVEEEEEAEAEEVPLRFPAEVEDDQFWERFHMQILPMMQSLVSEHGEVLYIRTARRGARSTGRFSRPDLTYVVVGRYPLIGEKFLDVTSVEAKLWSAADDIANAYEAIAYKRFSTTVYYAYEAPDASKRISPDVTEVLKENGVGIIRIWHEGNSDKLRIDAEPVRWSPAIARLEAHLENLLQIDEKGLRKLLHSKYR